MRKGYSCKSHNSLELYGCFLKLHSSYFITNGPILPSVQIIPFLQDLYLLRCRRWISAHLFLWSLYSTSCPLIWICWPSQLRACTVLMSAFAILLNWGQTGHLEGACLWTQRLRGSWPLSYTVNLSTVACFWKCFLWHYHTFKVLARKRKLNLQS